MDGTLPDAGGPDDDVFRALASRPRRELLLLLADGESPVGELAERFEISRPAVSKHLAVLRRAGLVSVRPDGRKNLYRLNHEPLREALSWLLALDRFWADHLDDVGERLDDEDGT